MHEVDVSPSGLNEVVSRPVADATGKDISPSGLQFQSPEGGKSQPAASAAGVFWSAK